MSKNSTETTEATSRVLNDLFRELRVCIEDFMSPRGLDRIEALLHEIRQAPGDEEEKLRKKDDELDKAINDLDQIIKNVKAMPAETVNAFKQVIIALKLIELILMELKILVIRK